MTRPYATPTVVSRMRDTTTDGGFTLIETVTAIGIISVVMAALTAFFTTSISLINQQGGQEVAVQIANAATGKARTVKGSDLADGRDQAGSHAQWNNPVTGVAPYLADMNETWDTSAAAGSGSTSAANLPTVATATTVNNVPYLTYWYLGTCWQPAGGGACGKTQSTGAASFYRVVVAVTWRNQRCSATTCSFVTSALISNAAREPLFNINGLSPASLTIVNPGNLSGNTGSTVSRQFAATAAVVPLTWTFTGLPTGLSWTTGGLVTGTLPSTAGSFTVKITVKDSTNTVDATNLIWTVTVPLPANATGLTASRPCTVIPAGTPAFRAASSASGAAAAGYVDVTTPAAQTGDLLLAVVLATNVNSPVTPASAGWTAGTMKDGSTVVGPEVSSGTSNNAQVFWRIATLTQPATYRFGWTDTTQSGSVVLASYSGVDPSNPLGSVSITKQYGGTGVTGEALTVTSTPGRYVLATMATSTLPATALDPFSTTDAALVARSSVAAANSAGRLALWDKSYPSAGSTGTPLVSWPGSARPALAFSMLLQPRTSSTVDQTVTLTWTPPSDTTITGYTVVRGTTTTSVTGRTTATWSDTTTAANTAYTYSLKSVNSAGSSSGVAVAVAACP